MSQAPPIPSEEPLPSALIIEIEAPSNTTKLFRPLRPVPGSWPSSAASSKTSLLSNQAAAPCKNCEDARTTTEAFQERLKEATETARDLGYLKGFAEGLESAVKTYREMWRFHCEWELKLVQSQKTS